MAFQVSLVMAVKNAARYLQAALDSVAAQTEPVSEIVIVDGGSTDETEAIARRTPHVRFIQESSRGFASAWNDGIRASTGEAIAILDSDDLWTPDKTRLQVAALLANPAAGVVIGHMEFFIEPGETLPRSFKPELLGRAHVAHLPSGALIRRTVFDTVGLFEIGLQIANDVDWFLRVKDRGVPTVIIPDVVARKRVHSRNLSYGATEGTLLNDELIDVLRRSIHRQQGRTTGR